MARGHWGIIRRGSVGFGSKIGRVIAFLTVWDFLSLTNNGTRVKIFLGDGIADLARQVPISPELERDQIVWGPECLVKPKGKFK